MFSVWMVGETQVLKTVLHRQKSSVKLYLMRWHQFWKLDGARWVRCKSENVFCGSWIICMQWWRSKLRESNGSSFYKSDFLSTCIPVLLARGTSNAWLRWVWCAAMHLAFPRKQLGQTVSKYGRGLSAILGTICLFTTWAKSFMSCNDIPHCCSNTKDAFCGGSAGMKKKHLCIIISSPWSSPAVPPFGNIKCTGRTFCPFLAPVSLQVRELDIIWQEPKLAWRQPCFLSFSPFYE